MKSIIWDYINEENEILNNLLLNNEIRNIIIEIGEIDAIYFVSHGSSYNASLTIGNFITKLTGIRTYSYTPANFLYNCNSYKLENKEKTLIIGISQTGTSRGTIQALATAQEFKTLAITEKDNSPIQDISDYRIKLNCGEENSNAKTKGYSSTLLVLLIFGLEYALQHQKITIDRYRIINQEIQDSINQLDKLIISCQKWLENLNFGKEIDNIFVLGCGMNIGTAFEAQLKLMETLCMPTVYADIEEFSHGTHRAINSKSSVLLLKTDKYCQELFDKTFEYLLIKTDNVIMINASENISSNPRVLNIEYFPEIESVITLTTIVQILSVFIPELNGLDPNVNSNDDYTDWVKTRI